MGRGSGLFWHVPIWYNGPPSNAAGLGNQGDNIVEELLETETASDSLAPDNYFVERIIGQYKIVTTQPADVYMHHRIYVAQAGSGYIQLRDPSSIDDADTSFLMHKVEGFSSIMTGSIGSWYPLGSPNSGSYGAPPISRPGGFDVRVNRKVEEGESLIWHTKFEKATGEPVDQTWFLQMWCRVLLRQL